MSWSEQAFERLWVRLGEAYGRRFFEEFGEVMPEAWRDRVSTLGYDQVRYALETCGAAGDAHPVNLSTFMQRARNAPRDNRFGGPRLPPPPQDPQKRERAMEAMRGARIGSGGRNTVLLPGESFADYQVALREAMASGASEGEFRAARLAANGWSAADEEQYRHHAQHVRVGG